MTNRAKYGRLTREQIKALFSDSLCEFCPWIAGEIPHRCDSQCDGRFCDEAIDNWLESDSA